MAIYPDKKNGALNGRWRVELQQGGQRYRKRWNTHAEAVADEKAVLASWATGEAPPAPGQAPGAPTVHTLTSVIELGKGNLWEGKDTEGECWDRMEIIASLKGGKTVLDEIDTAWVDSLITKLRDVRGIADGTVNRYLSNLKTFLTWAKKRKYRTLPVTGEDGIGFSWKRESKGRIRWVTYDEEREALAFLRARTHESAYQAEAVADLIEVAIESGCRRDELLTVELGQLNGYRLHLWETKTDTPRTVPLSPARFEKLRNLVASGTMPTRRGLRSWWNRVRDHMGLTEDADFVFHACRHTCATRMVDADVNVFVIKEWMGHKCIETTLRYAHVKPKNLEEALAKVGEHLRLVAENPEKSALSKLLTHLPTHGGIDDYEEAA